MKTVTHSNLLNPLVLICRASCSSVLVGKLNEVEKCVKFFCYNNLDSYRYRGEVLKVIDKAKIKVGLVDVGNFSVDRSIKEIFRMPSKYKGKSLVSKHAAYVFYFYNLKRSNQYS